MMSPDSANSLQIRRVDRAGHAVLCLQGSLDIDGAPVLTEELRRLLDTGIHNADLDLSEVGFVSSLGIGCLIAGVGDFEQVGGKLALVGVSEELRDMFGVLDLLDYLQIR